MSTLAVIIPVRNMATTLRRAVASAAEGGADSVVIVDDASDDGTAEVASLCAEEWSCVSVVTHPEKTADHNVAQEPVWRGIKCDQIVGLSADDFLYPGAVWSLKLAAGSPVAFADYDVFDADGKYFYSQHSHFYGRKTAAEIRRRFSSIDYCTETGFCTAIRRDIAMWLWSSGWQALGPMMDGVGLMTAAALFGAAYIPMKCGSFTLRDGSYGCNSSREGSWYFDRGMEAVEWIRSCGLDGQTTKAIVKLRCFLNDKLLEESIG